MTSNHHAPYDLGYTRATMDNTKGSETVRSSKSHKVVLSSDCSLQLDYMKLNRSSNRRSACYGEYVPGSCTHRPSHHESL